MSAVARKHLLFPIYFLIVGLMAPNLAWAGPVRLKTTDDYIDLRPFLGVYESTSGDPSVSADPASDLPEVSLFHPSERVSFGFRHAPVWFRMEFHNESDIQDWVLALGNPSIDSADLYLRDASGRWIVQRNGLNVPHSKRVLSAREFVFPIEMETGEEAVYYLRLASNSSLFFDPVLWPRDQYARQETRKIHLLMIVIGIFFALLFSNLVLAFRSPERNHVYLVGLDLAFGLFLASSLGISHLYLWPENPTLARLAWPVFGGLSLAFGSLYARSVMRLPVMHKISDCFYALIAVLAVVMIVLNPFIHLYSNIVIASLSMLMTLVTLILCIQKIRSSTEIGRFFGAVLLAGLACGFLFDLMLLGFLPWSVWSASMGPVAFVVISIALLFTVGHRVAVMQRRYARIFDSVSDALLLLDIHAARILQANDKALELLGYSHLALIRKGLPGILAKEKSDWRQRLDELAAMDALKEESYTRFVTLLRRDGGTFRAEVTLHRADQLGNKQILVMVRDVTEAREREMKLRHQQKLEAIGTLASGVAHEINNPLTIVMNYGEIIGDAAPSGSEIRDHARIIVDECRRIASIVKNLLAFARKDEVGKSAEAADMVEIVNSTLSLTNKLLQKDRIQLVTNISQVPLLLHCRPQQIKQVLMNLISNARDALNERYPGANSGKCLYIRVDKVKRANRSWLCIEVEDSGTGIPPDVCARIFDPFFTTKPEGRGTGLGLAISHGMIKEHGGEIIVDSKEGMFTRFRVLLPMG